MSSTSSSECMCPKCNPDSWKYRIEQDKNVFYQALGEPLIYYAQTKQRPQFWNKGRKDSSKHNPNCFVRAFRWYTQDFERPRPESCSKPRGLPEFAVWLDQKYDEFLQDRQCCDVCPNTPREPSPCAPSPCAPTPCVPSPCARTPCAADNTNSASAPPCEPCRPKIFSRVRSPWRRKHRSKERNTAIEKHLQSLEFIMEPKELSRPASEFYPQAPTNTQSKISVVTSDSQISKKTIVKSRSAEKSACDKCCTPEVDRNDGPNIGKLEDQRSLRFSQHTVDSKPQTYSLAKDVSCQCPKEKLMMVDTQTQYCDSDWSSKVASQGSVVCRPMRMPSKQTQKVCDKKDEYTHSSKYVMRDVAKKRSNVSCQCSQILPNTDTVYQPAKKHRNVECYCVLSDVAHETKEIFNEKDTSAIITRCVNYPCRPIILQKSLKTSNNQTPNDGTYQNRYVKKNCKKDNALQTSDNSIDLERDGVRKYPLFMKIVCADKLKEERTRF